MNDLISIIVPIYNIEKYIERCVRSLINQTYQNIEIILVDDGSTDNSGNIADKLANQDTRIKCIHQKNGGLSAARNTGLNVAKGNYYSFIDGDDYIKSETIEKLYLNAVKYHAEIAVCNMIRFYEDNSTEAFYKPCNHVEVLDQDDRFKTLNQPSVCNKLFKKGLFNDVKFPVGKYYEDTYVYHILCYRASRIVLTGYDGYWYYSRKGSILGDEIFNNKYFDFIEAVWMRAQYLIKKDIHPYSEEACLSLYVAYSNANKNIVKSKENNHQFEQAKSYYLDIYKYLIHRNISFKQKIRLFLLRYFPKLHTKIY